MKSEIYTIFLTENLWEDVGIDGINRDEVMWEVWIEFILLRIGITRGLFWTC
jgi:hypothetical protein